MSKTCLKYKCPNRRTIGKENDEDVISIICPKCEQVLYTSDQRKTKYKKASKRILLILCLTSVFVIILCYKNQIINSIPPNENMPDTVVKKFMSHINNMAYYEAFELTKNEAWYPYEKFKRNVHLWNNIEIGSIKGKSYYSKYKADTILNVKYNAIIKDTIRRLDYDFHLKKYNNDWKIVRLLYSRDIEIKENLAVISDADGYTNLRSGKGTHFSVIRKIYTNQQFYVYPNSEKWWQVRLKDGTQGYVFHNRIDILDQSFYILNVMATKTETQALEEVEKLEKIGYAAGHLWIPNYKSLSGAKFYSVYIGPFKSKKECKNQVLQYRKINPNAYGILVSQENKREVIK